MKFLNTKQLACAALIGASAGLAHAAPPIQHWTQASGAQVYLVESPGIPMLDVQIDFDAGARRDPPGRAGLASATALMTGKGIAAQGSAPALDENQVGAAWADLGASFDADASNDRMSFRLRTLTDPQLLPQSVALAARQLAAPDFPAKVWQRERESLSAALREARTRPGTVAGIAFSHAVFDPHPYGYETTPESLAAVSVQDMRRFYTASIQPCRAKLSLVGAVTRAQADDLARQLLAGLPAPAACAPLPPVPPVQPLAAAREIDIPFASAQAHVLMGQPGYRRADPDHFALNVGNYILGGGGFVSRLTDQVREKRGLSYSVYSSFAPGLDAGAFVIGLQTRPDQAGQALTVARQVLTEFVANGPTDAEVKAAQDNLVNGFALLIDSNAKLLANVANIAWNDLPLDYLDTWSAHVQSITAADIKAAFARKVDPARMVTVVVGGKP